MGITAVFCIVITCLKKIKVKKRIIISIIYMILVLGILIAIEKNIYLVCCWLFFHFFVLIVTMLGGIANILDGGSNSDSTFHDIRSFSGGSSSDSGSCGGVGSSGGGGSSRDF